MWYVVHTMSGKEQACMQQCVRQLAPADYEDIFVPRYISRKHFQREWHDVEKILFPGYFFVDTERIEPVMDALLKVPQYARVLREADMVAPITAEEQRFLADMMDEQHIVRYSEGFLIGDRVCITSGPLRDYQGCIRAVDRHRRVARLDIPICGRQTPVEVGFGAVHRVSRDEFDEMKRQAIQKSRQASENRSDLTTASEEETGHVRVLRGVFAGMTGKLLAADAERDEWIVELELFGTPTKVTCHKQEIEV